MFAGDRIAPEPCASELGSAANGADVRNTMVAGSGDSTAVSGSQRGRFVVLRFLSIIRSMLNLTAAASQGVPSWKTTPARSFSVIDLRSGLIS